MVIEIKTLYIALDCLLHAVTFVAKHFITVHIYRLTKNKLDYVNTYIIEGNLIHLYAPHSNYNLVTTRKYLV